MKIRDFAIMGALSLVLLGCATAPTVSEMRTDIQGFQLPMEPAADNSVVYIVRPSNVGFLIGFRVYVDQKETPYYVGETHGGQYIYFKVTPGSHVIISQAENTAEYPITAEAGKVYFLQQVPSMGIIIARNDLFIAQDIEGKYWVKHLKVGSLK